MPFNWLWRWCLGTLFQHASPCRPRALTVFSTYRCVWLACSEFQSLKDWHWWPYQTIWVWLMRLAEIAANLQNVAMLCDTQEKTLTTKLLTIRPSHTFWMCCNSANGFGTCDNPNHRISFSVINLSSSCRCLMIIAVWILGVGELMQRMSKRQMLPMSGHYRFQVHHS